MRVVRSFVSANLALNSDEEHAGSPKFVEILLDREIDRVEEDLRMLNVSMRE